MKEIDSLQRLAEYYPARDRSSLADLASHYRNKSEQEILEIAAIAADVSANSILNLGLEPESDPRFMESFQLQYPNVNLDSLVGASEERLAGLANGIKGKYFEVLVRDRLNNGESLGELRLGPGQVARLAESPTQEGWDLEIVNVEDGSLVEQLQLKATTSMSYVKTALEKYPDIRVAVPSDIDGVKDEILRTDISDNDLTEAVNRQLGEQSEDALNDMLDQSAEWAFDTIPIVSGILVGLTEGRLVLIGQSSLEESLQRGARRLGRSTAFSTLGATLVALDAGILSVPTTTAARVAWSRVTNRIASGEYLQMKTSEILESIGQINPESKMELK
ncbi:MAG: hypothetical protein IID01_07080 [Chloroflexi bacterium]|nr:hypothetical protein [Chloroflexota bacterium]